MCHSSKAHALTIFENAHCLQKKTSERGNRDFLFIEFSFICQIAALAELEPLIYSYATGN